MTRSLVASLRCSLHWIASRQSRVDEKVASLGRLAAGLAHELNNPASAVARSAKTLVAGLAALDDATGRFSALNLSGPQCSAVAALRDEPPSHAAQPPIELPTGRTPSTTGSTRTTWPASTPSRSPIGARPGRSRHAGGARWARTSVDAVLAHESAQRAVRQLATEIETAASRIHSLVAAVKGFTYVNQQATLHADRDRTGVVRHDYRPAIEGAGEVRRGRVAASPSDLPDVEGYGGELNQVWANLVDNAIDATPGGHVRVDADSAGGTVIVRVIDDGPGHPAESPAASSIRSSPPRTSARGRASASTSPAASSSGITASST